MRIRTVNIYMNCHAFLLCLESVSTHPERYQGAKRHTYMAFLATFKPLEMSKPSVEILQILEFKITRSQVYLENLT